MLADQHSIEAERNPKRRKIQTKTMQAAQVVGGRLYTRNLLLCSMSVARKSMLHTMPKTTSQYANMLKMCFLLQAQGSLAPGLPCQKSVPCRVKSCQIVSNHVKPNLVKSSQISVAC